MEEAFLSTEEFLQQIRWRVQHTLKDSLNYKQEDNKEIMKEHYSIMNDVLLPLAIKFDLMPEAIRIIEAETKEWRDKVTAEHNKELESSQNLTEEIPKELV